MNGRNQPATVQQLSWMQPAYLGIQWPREQILPTPYEEIDHDEFMRLMFCGAYGLCGINYEQTFLSQDRADGLWAVTYYFFPEYALAVGERYANLPDETNKMLGMPLTTGDNHGHLLHFWRIGCQHKNMTTHWAAMHDRRDNCPDCGFHANYDTSG